MTVGFDLIIRGGAVVDGSGAEPRRADVGVTDDRIVELGDLSGQETVHEIDATGRLVFPGFIDAHSHADALLDTPRVQEAYLRQGVTSVILGQDGVSFVPSEAAGVSYPSRYFAAINGPVPADLDEGGTVAEFLALREGRGAINAGYLIPAAVVRASVVGFADRPAGRWELEKMQELVANAMADGALGLSTGLDYVPGRFADRIELAALCDPVGRADGVYASHLRGYGSDQVATALDELGSICAASGARAHASHLHGRAEVIEPALAAVARDHGVTASFDSYPYLNGSTIVAMLLLPAELQNEGPDVTIERLRDPDVRRRLREEWLPANGRLSSIRLSYLAEPDWRWAEGLGIVEAAERFGGATGGDLADFVCEALVANDLAVGCVVGNGADRTESDLRTLLRREEQLAGSDAIFLGSRPHPRGWGAFSRLLGRHVRELGDWSWGQAAWHLSGNAAERFGLIGRGRLGQGAIADLAVIDPDTVSDLASYDSPTELAVGVSHVVVAGTVVLDERGLTQAGTGRALRAQDGSR